MSIGTLYGIGAGTGDPELLTIKAVRVLQRSPIVAYPLGIQGKPGMAETIIAQWLTPTQGRLALRFPYVQDDEILNQAWQEAAERVWHHLKQGEDVAFACEGDISFYSTFNYLAQTLQAAHPEVGIELIPGITSPMAAAAVLGVPLTVRSQRLAILPALYTVEELERVLDWAEVVVLMKVSSVYQLVWRVLEQRHLLQSAAVVERATLPDQKVYRDLSQSPDLTLSYFSILIIRNCDH